MRNFFKTGITAMSLLLTFVLLSACIGSNLTGTWYVENAKESFFNIEKNGNISGYNAENDMIYYGSWTKNNGSYLITGLADHDLEIELTDKDTLYCEEYVFTLKRGPANNMPNITVSELTDDTWITDDGRYELEFYTTDWDLYDLDVGDFLEGGTYIIEDGILTMESEDGIQYLPKIAENRHEITVFDDMVFIMDK